MTRNNFCALFAIASLLLATNVFALSYFAAAKIEIDTSEINSSEAVGRLVKIMTSLGYTVGTNTDSNGVQRTMVESEHFIRIYFFAFGSDNPFRERFEVTVTQDKNKREIEVYFRELMTKKFSDLGVGYYQNLVDKLRDEFGKYTVKVDLPTRY